MQGWQPHQGIQGVRKPHEADAGTRRQDRGYEGLAKLDTPYPAHWEIAMARSFRDVLEELVNERIAAGEDPSALFEELHREANLVFGHYSLEYELGMMLKDNKPE
jgi:hypothetical protein